MKLIICLILIVLTCSGCHSAAQRNEAQPIQNEIYDNKIDAYSPPLIGGTEDEEILGANQDRCGGTWESEIYMPVLLSWEKAVQEGFGYNRDNQEVKEYPFICVSFPNEFSQMHYAYYDVDDNGTLELLIAAFFDSNYYHLADVFSIRDSTPVRLFEGVEDRGFWSRNRLDFSKDGHALIVSSSGGAAYTDLYFYRISENGYQVELIEGLSSYNPDDLEDISPYHHLSDGSYAIASNADGIMEQYYDRGDPDRQEDPYYSDFHLQIMWQPIMKN